ncbi:AP-3 complex subunit delta [Striga hermonthica]|uniref:AP-3 complex subunit delta n=1 Tax=Striga hermonthica TaxID=68872 RepID=A0A9N7MX25_STRHE|nr:AP-3 complex subunit delta [Striga hermonthica]
MAGPSLMDSLFQRSVDDVIKGIRLSPPGTEPAFIARSLDEIRREIKSTDPETKAVALHKLAYLHSLHGADMSWAAFHAVELSSSVAHHQKRVAYLAASLSFDPSTTQVILLLTHQLRKDLSSSNVHDVSLALSTLSSICNPDLARDLTPELFALLGSSKLFVRKKALAAVLRVFEQYPDAVRVCFKRVVENLENADMGILSAVVGLFCELTEKEPRSYLPLAPEFYKILVDCRNNWVLIKVLKIFANLAPLEPRLAKRIVEPICEHMGRTGAKSLAFECVRTIMTSLSEYDSAVKLAVGKVREFLLEDDPNLKYLGLQALAILSDTNVWAVLENKDLVVKALSDVDENIKLEALRLVMCMVSEDNVMEICRILISQALKSDPKFCNEILDFILRTCSRNLYEVVYDFDWYVSFLGDMARVPHCHMGSEIEDQLVDIGMRVKDARFQLVQVARDLVIDPALLGNPFIHGVLAAAAWISGEYVELSRNPFEITEALLQPRTSLLTPSVRAVYIQSVFKVLVFCLNSYLKLNGDDALPSVPAYSDFKDNEGDFETVASQPLPDGPDLDNPNLAAKNGQNLSSSRTQHLSLESLMVVINLIETNLGPLAGSNEVEVQERARNVLGLIKLIKPILLDQREVDTVGEGLKHIEVVKLIFGAFSKDLGPVSSNAQERVPVPDGLVLKENLRDLDDICGETQLPVSTSFSLVKHSMVVEVPSHPEHPSKEEFEPSSKSTSLLAEHRKRHGLYYLPSEKAGTTSNDYPPAHDPKETITDEAEDLVKLTEQSLVIRKKPNQAKPRPVVVKLDDGEGFNLAAKTPEFKADVISGAVQEVLLGNEATASTSRRKSSNRSSKRRVVNDLNVGVSEPKNETVKADVSEIGNPGSGRRKHHGHGKERKNRNSGKDKDHENKDKQKSEHAHGKHRSRHRADGALAAQSPVIPDFLL